MTFGLEENYTEADFVTVSTKCKGNLRQLQHAINIHRNEEAVRKIHTERERYILREKDNTERER